MKQFGTQIALAALCAPMFFVPLVCAQPKLTPVEYRSHFQPNASADPASGSRDGWESFPITQETGYEPTLNPETIHSANMLVREAAPTQSGDFQLGFTRRMHIASGNASALSFQIRVPYATGNVPVTISLFRGKEEERLSAVAYGARWQAVHVRPKPSSALVTAIAIAANFPHSVRGRMERVEIQEVHFTGTGVARLALSEPATLWDASRNLYYLQRAAIPGGSLHVRAARTASWTLTTPNGTIAAQSQGASFDHTFSATDPFGIWTIHAATVDADATARVLVRSAQPHGLLFDAPPAIAPELLASVRKRRDLLRPLAHVDVGNNIAQMDPHWLLAGLSAYFDDLLQSPELAMLDAVDYRSSGNQASLDEAQALLRSIAGWPQWAHPWFPAHGYHSYYPVGIMTKYVVLAEEFLGKDLSPGVRSALDQALMTQAVKPIYTEYVFEDRLQFNTSNWIGNTDGGALLAALESRDPDAPGYALGLFEKERDHIQAAYTADGSYGEGITYHRFDLEMTSLVAETAKRLLGTSLDASFAGGERYLMYAAYGSDYGVLDYGDSHVDLRPSNVFAQTASLNQSDTMADFYFRYRDTDTAELLSRILWEGKIKPAAAPLPAMPLTTVFAERGIAVLRDSWSPDATVITIRAGRNFNHNHADEGSVFYARGGEVWLGEAGYADYYKDPSYPTFTIQAVGHNTLLVDDNPESQMFPGNTVFGTYPMITRTEFAGDVSIVEAELASVYRSDVQRYTRTLVAIKGGSTFVIDRFTSLTPHTFTQIWHPEQPIIQGSDTESLFTLRRGDASLQVHAFSTLPLRKVLEQSPLPLTAYDLSMHQPIERPMQVRFTTAESLLSGMIVTVISPTSGVSIRSEKKGAGLLIHAGQNVVDVPASGDVRVSHL